MNLNVGDFVICLRSYKKFKVKYSYSFGMIIVYDDKRGFDFPLRLPYYVPCSPLMEELI